MAFQSMASGGWLRVVNGKLIKSTPQIYPPEGGWFRKVGNSLVSTIDARVELPIPIISKDYEELFNFCGMGMCLDIYDRETDEVVWWKQNHNKNQLWKRLLDVSPQKSVVLENKELLIPEPDRNYIASHWSPNKNILIQQQKDYESNFGLGVKIFYKSIINPADITRYITNIPLIATDGDNNVMLPNGKNIGPLTLKDIQKYGLLTYRERRIARGMTTTSLSKVFAWGGYRSKTTIYRTPKVMVVISMAAPQFEFDRLEYNDFIVDGKNRETLFPSYYSQGKIPSLEEAKNDPNNFYVGNNRYFLENAYCRACIEDIMLILYSFEEYLKEGHKGWLKLTALGMGFFANLPQYGSLSKMLEPLFIKAVKTVLETSWKLFPHIKVVEFPNFSGTYKAPILKSEFGVLVTTEQQDLLYVDSRHQDYLVGIVNPSDVFSYKGNEFGYASVEAEIGNNTDIRYRQTAIFNQNLLDPQNRIRV